MNILGIVRIFTFSVLQSDLDQERVVFVKFFSDKFCLVWNFFLLVSFMCDGFKETAQFQAGNPTRAVPSRLRYSSRIKEFNPCIIISENIYLGYT